MGRGQGARRPTTGGDVTAVGRTWLVVALAVAWGMALLGTLVPASTAKAALPAPATSSVTLTATGCSVLTIPSGMNTVAIQATGATGSYGLAGSSTGVQAYAPGGDGSTVSANLTFVSGQLYVCVNVGGGTGTSTYPGSGWGNGGGASGVSLGPDFSRPVVVAGGGGGGADFPIGGCSPCGDGHGGSAGYPNGANGDLGTTYIDGAGGGGGTQTSGGAGGRDYSSNAPGGSCSSSTGPGVGGSDNDSGGYGAGGGAGYCAGGAGGGTGQSTGAGGGGSDFCTNGVLPSVPVVWNCSENAAGGAQAQVVLTYSYTTPQPTVYVADAGSGYESEVPGWGAAQRWLGYGADPPDYSKAAGLAVDANGNLFYADYGNGIFETVGGDPNTEVQFDGNVTNPTGVAIDQRGDLFMATGTGVLKLPAGGDTSHPVSVGSTASAPQGVAVDAVGNVFIADTNNNRVVEVPANGGPQITIYGGPKTSSLGSPNLPNGVAVDSAGDVLIADTMNNRVLKVRPSGVVSTVGSGLSYPEGIALDANGDVFIANAGGADVVEVPADGSTQTMVGSGFSRPSGVAVFAPPPTFTADTPPGYAPQGQPYTYTYTAQTPAGQPAATFAVASGSLPPGLTLDPTTGVLSGTPTAGGAWTFQVQTENAANATASPPTTIVTALPTVTGVSPAAGPTSAGTPVTITGTNFAIGFTMVDFGSNAATSVQVQSPTTLTALAPAGDPGSVDVTVTTAGGTSLESSADQYTYVAAPTVSQVSPNFGPIAGQNTVTITGANFVSGATVNFGSNAATSVNVQSSTTLTAVAPVGSYGTVDVTVTTPGGTSATSTADQYRYGRPTVTAVSPTAGPPGGGNTVTITGTNFASGARVKFGANAGTSVNVQSATQLTAVAPAGTGTVSVTVTTAGGASATSAADQYAYAPPSVSAVNPSFGPTAGGNTVTITGTNFVADATVDFGSNPATAVSVQSATHLTATAPAGTYGTVDVTVGNADGTSATSSGDKYGYGQPSVSVVSPKSGPGNGGQSVTITGTNFATGATVQFGSAAATSVQVSSSTQLTATAPPGTGTVDVTVTTPQGGPSATAAADHYAYIASPSVTAVSPSSGPVGGGNTITITGAHFASGATVNVGANAATSVTLVSGSKLTAVAPAGGYGAVDVTVTTPQGATSLTSSADRYTYRPQAGALYAVDTGNTLGSGELVQMFPGGPQTTLASGLGDPGGVAVDAAGDVFVAQYSPANNVVEYLADGGQRTLASGTNPTSVAVDPRGDVFVGDSSTACRSSPSAAVRSRSTRTSRMRPVWRSTVRVMCSSRATNSGAAVT